MAISAKLKKMILPNLKMELRPHELKHIDEYFTECYLTTNSSGREVIALKPQGNTYLCMEFFALNGAYSNMAFWEEAKQKGILL